MRQIDVRIMGQNYLLGCAEGSEEELLEAVKQVDQEMCLIRDAGKLRARERIAVLAALNIALAAGSKPVVKEPAYTPPQEEQGEIYQQLIQRIDSALMDEERLL